MTIPDLAAKVAEMWVSRRNVSVSLCAFALAPTRTKARIFLRALDRKLVVGTSSCCRSREIILSTIQEMARGN